MTQWEYLVMPLKDAARLKNDSHGLAPRRLNELGAEGWEAVGVSLKQGDLIAWPVVLLKRQIHGDTAPGHESRHSSQEAGGRA